MPYEYNTHMTIVATQAVKQLIVWEAIDSSISSITSITYAYWKYKIIYDWVHDGAMNTGVLLSNNKSEHENHFSIIENVWARGWFWYTELAHDYYTCRGA